MNKINANIYTNLDGIEETQKILAIKDINVIKYIDLTNNKVTLYINDNKMIRENNDYIFEIDFNKNNIIIYMKKTNKQFNKEINTIFIKKNNNSYNVKYKLLDEDIINEYYIKY